MNVLLLTQYIIFRFQTKQVSICFKGKLITNYVKYSNIEHSKARFENSCFPPKEIDQLSSNYVIIRSGFMVVL